MYSGLTRSELEPLLTGLTGPTALDFETSGLEPFFPDSFIRCVSLASREACLAIDLKSLDGEALDFFWSWAASHPGFLFHNALFDTMWAQMLGKPLRILRCTSALFRHMSTEGWVGQSWSLKTAMTDVLLWPEQNTEDLYAWLKANKMGKEQMSWAPWELLGKYAALDAEATYLLYDELTMQLQQHPMPDQVKANLLDYHDVDTQNLIALLREQQIEGMQVDMELLDKYAAEREASIVKYRADFFAHELVQGPFERLHDKQIAELLAMEPPQLTAKGDRTKRWEAWHAKVLELNGAHYSDIFNMDSPQQLAWLFYTELKYPVAKETTGGQASVDKKVLGQLGPIGKLLMDYRKQRDKLKFVESLRGTQINGVLHPMVMVSATVTGRCGGGNR